MSNSIKVSIPHLEAVHSQVRSTVTKVNSQLDTLKSDLRPLVSTWEGQAKDNYQAVQAKWDQAAADLNQVLQQIANALGDTHEGYHTVESDNAKRWAQ